MEESLAKVHAGETPERFTRRKTMEHDATEKKRGHWSQCFLTLNGWVDWDRQMETVMDSADATKLLREIFENLPIHRRKVIDEETMYDELSERVRHLKIVMKTKSGSEEQDLWQIRNTILDMHRMGKVGWVENLRVQVK